MIWSSQNRWIVIFALRCVLAAVIFVAGLQIAKRWWDKLGMKVLALYYGMRLILMWVLINVAHFVPPDICCWRSETIEPVLSGLHTAWSLPSVYYYGFVEMGVLFCRLFNSGLGLVFMFILAEFAAMIILFKVLKNIYCEKVAKMAVIIYLASPFGIVVSWLGAQDEPLIMLAMFLFLYFTLIKDNGLGRLFSIVFGILFSKILVLFYMFPMVIQKRIKGLVALMLIFTLYFLLRYFSCDNILAPRGLSRVVTLGNIWYLLGIVPSWMQFAVFTFSAFMFSLCIAPEFIGDGASAKRRLEASMVLSICLGLVLALTHKMVFAAYLLPMTPFMIVLLLVQGAHSASCGLKVISVAWLFVAAFIDPFLYGMGCFRNHWLLNVVNVLGIFLNLSFLFMVIKCKRQFFHHPAKAFLCVVRYLTGRQL